MHVFQGHQGQALARHRSTEIVKKQPNSGKSRVGRVGLDKTARESSEAGLSCIVTLPSQHPHGRIDPGMRGKAFGVEHYSALLPCRLSRFSVVINIHVLRLILTSPRVRQ